MKKIEEAKFIELMQSINTRVQIYGNVLNVCFCCIVEVQVYVDFHDVCLVCTLSISECIYGYYSCWKVSVPTLIWRTYVLVNIKYRCLRSFLPDTCKGISVCHKFQILILLMKYNLTPSNHRIVFHIPVLTYLEKNYLSTWEIMGWKIDENTGNQCKNNIKS